MGNLFARYEALRRKVGGNREKQDYEMTFGSSVEELNHITSPNRTIVRILSEIDYAIKLSRANGGKFDDAISSAIAILENAMETDGVLAKFVCMKAEEALLPLSDAAKEYEIIFASHAHIDMNWMWGWQETVAVTISTFRTILNLMEEYPDYTFSQSQASVYKIIEEYAPDMMPEIQHRIKEGRWEVTAAAWVETDKNMPDTESLIRHIEYTRNYLENTWDIPREKLDLDFSPDTFGHSPFIPEINTFGKVKYYYHCRGLQDDLTLYRYKCPSGAEVLMCKEPYWYNSGVNPDCATGIFGLSERCAGLKTGLIVYGVGNHGGGPSRRDIERVLEMQQWPVFPTMKFGTIHDYFAKAESVRDQLPVVDHELNAIFAGCYTTQSRIKRGNRKTEQALLDAEKLAAVRSTLTGASSPAALLEKAWQNVLFTHFHDILTGSGVQETREYAMGLFAQALGHAQTTESDAMRAISDMTDTSAFMADPDIRFTLSEGAGVGFGIPNHSGVPNPERGVGKTRIYTVFNTAPCAKDEAVEITLWDYPGDLRRLEAVDSAFNPLEMQIIDKQPIRYWDHRYVRVLVKCPVPAMGYATVALREKPVTDYPTFYLRDDRVELPMGDINLENEYVKAIIDGRSGQIISYIDKETGKELLSAPAGLCVVDTEHNNMSGWRIGRYLKINPIDKAIRITPSMGNLLQSVETEHSMLDSTVKTTISLAKGAKAIKYELSVDWHENARKYDTYPVLIYRMPLAEAADEVIMDVPAGCATRTARAMDLPALSYAAAKSGNRVPFIVTDCKYGYRLDRNELIATLINTSDNPDPYPERGIHAIELYIGACSACPKALREIASSLIRPMFAMSAYSHEGKLPADSVLLGFEANSCILSSASGDKTGMKIRVYESCGKADKVTVTLPVEAKSACLTDLEGNVIGDACANGNKVTFEIAPYKLVQLLVNI